MRPAAIVSSSRSSHEHRTEHTLSELIGVVSNTDSPNTSVNVDGNGKEIGGGGVVSKLRDDL